MQLHSGSAKRSVGHVSEPGDNDQSPAKGTCLNTPLKLRIKSPVFSFSPKILFSIIWIITVDQHDVQKDC